MGSIGYNILNLPATVGIIKPETNYYYYYDANDLRSRVLTPTGGRYYINGADGKTEAVVDVNNSGLITHNVWGNDLVGQVNRNVSTLNRYYYLKDHLGSIRVTVNASNTVVGYDDYDPWGMILEGRSYVSNADARYRFTSQERDAETGNHWFVTRHYDGRIGRFFSVDAHADLYPSTSPFAYVGNNPVAFIDPTGMDSSYYNDKGQYAYVDDAGNNKLYESEQAAQLDWAQQMLGRWGEGDFYEGTSIKGKFHMRFVEAVNEWATVQDLLAIMEGEAGSVARLLNAQFDVHRRAAKYGEPVLPIIGTIETAGTVVGNLIRGYATKHAINSAISHEGGGVSLRAILNTLRNPLKVVSQAKGRTLYVGKDASVVLTKDYQVWTMWPRSTVGRRIK